MEDPWKAIPAAFAACLPNMPQYQRIVATLQDSMDGADCPNVLLYGKESIPHSILLDAALEQKYGPFMKETKTWNKQWVYEESPYYFEIDMRHPSQPRDVSSLSEFLREIASHQCMYAPRHTFLIRNMDIVCSKDMAYMLRVIFERYAKTTWFVCTTYKMDAIEPPLRSRFFLIRVPMPSHQEVQSMLLAMGRSLPQELLDDPCPPASLQKLPFAIFLSEWHCASGKSQGKALPYSTSTLATYNIPFLSDVKPNATIERIREWTQKICIHDYSISQMAQDLLQHHVPESRKHAFLAYVAHLEHLCASTSRFRKMLYVEAVLHAAIFGVPGTPTSSI